MKIKIFILLIIAFLSTGCVLDPYKNVSYGEKVIDSWFSYKEEDIDLGKTRRELENINKIISRSCKFIEKMNNKYIYSCKIKYKELGETMIPLSKDKTLNVYAVFILNNDGTYNYKVYNSSYKENIWKTDDELRK